MEQIGHVIGSNELTRQEYRQVENPRFENATSDDRQNYQDALYLIILDSFRLSSQAPTDEEIALRSQSWTRHLMGVVPEVELQRCFDRAFADHDSSFPVSAYDVKSAYDAILADERAAEAKRREERRRQLDAMTTEPKYLICDHCYNSGFRQIRNPNDPDGRWVVKCNLCNYWFNRRVNG